MAVAVYLASYFDINKSSKCYYKNNKDDIFFKQYFDEDFSKEEVNHEDFRQQLRKNFDFFKESCCKAENGDSEKLGNLLGVKKFFSIPWLICGESLIR